MHAISALRDRKQRSSTVSKEAPTVSKKLPPFCEGEISIIGVVRAPIAIINFAFFVWELLLKSIWTQRIWREINYCKPGRARPQLLSWENPASLNSRRIKSNSKVTQKWVSGSPPYESNILPRKSLFWVTFRVKKLFWGLLLGWAASLSNTLSKKLTRRGWGLAVGAQAAQVLCNLPCAFYWRKLLQTAGRCCTKSRLLSRYHWAAIHV